MKRLFLSVLALCVAIATVQAGDDKAHHAMMDPAAMKAEFSKCLMCRNMVPTMDEWMPSMKMEVVKLDNGMALIHTIGDAGKVASYHKAHDAMAAAGDACMKLTDEQAAGQLCMFCQDLRHLMVAGATASFGKTKTGDIMVLTATDPAVKARLDAYEVKCAAMAAM